MLVEVVVEVQLPRQPLHTARQPQRFHEEPGQLDQDQHGRAHDGGNTGGEIGERPEPARVPQIDGVVLDVDVAIELRRPAERHRRRVPAQEASRRRVVGARAQLVEPGAVVAPLPVVAIGVGRRARATGLVAIGVVAIRVGEEIATPIVGVLRALRPAGASEQQSSRGRESPVGAAICCPS